MSQEKKGLTYKVDADASSFTGTMKDLNSILNNTKKEIKALDKSLKLDSSDMEALTQQATALDKAIKLSTTKVEKLEKELEDLNKAEFIDERQIARVQAELTKTQSEIKELSSQKAEVDVKLAGNVDSELNDVKSDLDKIDSTTVEPEMETEGIEGSIEQIKSTFENMTGISIPFDTSKLAGISGLSTTAVAALGSIAAAAGVAALAVAGVMKAFKLSADAEKGLINIQNSLGATKDEAQKVSNVAKNIFGAGFGEDLNEVSNNVVMVKKAFSDLNDSDLEKLTKSIQTASNVTGSDFSETMRTAQTLMHNFGLTGEQATDVIIDGFQRGGDKNGDLLDSLNEYAPKFKQMGFTAKEFTDTLIAGADNGAWSVDKIGDAVKEFQIRATEGNDKVHKAFKDMGLNAKDMQKAFSKGGDESKIAFDKVLNSLNQVKDPLKRNQMGVELFGTMWEDLGENAVLSLANTEGAVEDLEGTTKKATKNIESSLSSQFDSISRGISNWFTTLGENMSGDFQNIFEGLKVGDPVKLITGIFGASNDIGKAVGELVGKIASAIINPATWVGAFVGIQSVAWGLITGLGEGLFNGIANIDFGKIGSQFITFFKTALNALSGFGSWVWQRISGFPKYITEKIFGKNVTLQQGINRTFNNAIKGLSKFGSWIWGIIGNFPAFVVSKMGGLGNKIKNSLVNAFKSAAKGLVNFGSWIWNSIKTGLNNLGKDVGNFLTNLNPFRAFEFGSDINTLGYSAQTIQQLNSYGENIKLRGSSSSDGGIFNSNSIVHRPTFHINISSSGAGAKSMAEDIMNIIETQYGRKFVY